MLRVWLLWMFQSRVLLFLPIGPKEISDNCRIQNGVRLYLNEYFGKVYETCGAIKIPVSIGASGQTYLELPGLFEFEGLSR